MMLTGAVALLIVSSGTQIHYLRGILDTQNPAATRHCGRDSPLSWVAVGQGNTGLLPRIKDSPRKVGCPMRPLSWFTIRFLVCTSANDRTSLERCGWLVGILMLPLPRVCQLQQADCTDCFLTISFSSSQELAELGRFWHLHPLWSVLPRRVGSCLCIQQKPFYLKGDRGGWLDKLHL